MKKYIGFIFIFFMLSCIAKSEKNIKPFNSQDCYQILSDCEENDEEKDIDSRFLITVNVDSNSQTGIYIPKTLDECFVELNKMLHPEAIKYLSGDLKNLNTEDLCKYRATFGYEFGRFLRNKWGLWGGSRLAMYFNELGISHPDDMFGIIIDSYKRHLRNEPIGLREQIKKYQRFWEITKQPEPYVDPKTGGKLIVTGGKLMQKGDHFEKYIYFGVNEKTGETWFYEYDKGWYKPDKKILKEFGYNY